MKAILASIPAFALCGLLLGQGEPPASEAKAGAPRNAWTIGVYTGPSPFRLSPPAGVTNPVLTAAAVNDMNVDTIAHPFMVIAGSTYYMFFTAKDARTDKGGIGLAESPNGLEWKFRRTVIREPFVLAHPYVFQWRNEYYMIPEAHTETSVRLYKATAFPDKWQFEAELLKGGTFISPTLARFKDFWWMFVSPSGNATLRLFYARELKGPWTEHPRSPIVAKDPDIARPGGRPFVIDGDLYRLGQDCDPTYGNQVHAFRITRITPTEYAEEMIETPLVKASSQGWNARAMHHVDAHKIGADKWLAAVDALGVTGPRGK